MNRFIQSLTPSRCRLILAAVLLMGLASRFAYINTDAPIDLSGDEAHYWDWSRQLDWSYYSKGPAVAYVIRFGCLIFGDSELGVRFPAMLLAIATALCTYWLTRRVFGSDRLALGAVLLCHVVPMFVAGSLLMTIDPIYYFGWALATCLAHVAIFGKSRSAWIGAGIAIGIAFLAKYAAFLWLACLLIYLLVYKPQRRWLRTPWPWLTIGVALLFAIPVIVWNAQHDWVTFGHVSRSTTENQSGFSPLEILSNFGSMVGSQIGLLNPIVAGFMVGGVVLAWRRRDRQFGGKILPVTDRPANAEFPALLFLLAYSLPFLGLVALVTIFKEIQPNWPVSAYFTLIPLATWFVATYWPRTKGWLIGAIVIGLLMIPVAHYSPALYTLIPGNPRKWDPAARLMGWQQIGQEVSLILRQSDLNQPFILCDKYQLTGLMAFYVDGQPTVYCAGSYWPDPKRRDRLSQYDMWTDRSLDQPSLIGRDAIYLGQEAPELKDVFERIERLADIPIVRNGKQIRVQRLWIGHNFKGMQRPDDGLTKR